MKAVKILTLKLILLSLLLGGLIYIIQQYLMPTWIHESVWTILAFFIILTWITGMFTHYLLQLSKENSVSILLGGIGLRLLSSIGFVAVMLMLGVENIILFIVNFFIVYFLYLLFDIYMLIANLRPNSR
jgi:hypothetical protein